MRSHFTNNWFFYLIGVGIALIVIWCIVRYIKSVNVPQDDSFYFVSIDKNGDESFIHDSGVRPSKTPSGNTITLQILKEEYNNGEKNIVKTPYSVKLGMNPKDLKWKVYPTNIKEEDVYYLIDITIPEIPKHNKSSIFPIDLREECKDLETPVP